MSRFQDLLIKQLIMLLLSLHKLDGGSFVKMFPLEVGSITEYSGRFKDTEIFYSFVSFLTPGLIYHCDLTENEIRPTVRYSCFL